MQPIEASQFENLFEEHLHLYDSDIDMVAQERTEQEQLETQVREANNNFNRARRGDTSSKEREKALQELENGYAKYKELIGNIDVGRKFYNDLAKIVGRFRDDCKSFVQERRMEASQLEKYVRTLSLEWPKKTDNESDITNATAMAALNISSHHPIHQQQPIQSQPPAPQPPAAQPLTAPQPTRANAALPPPVTNTGGIWSPDMGIRFGGPLPAPGSTQPGRQGNAGASAGTWDPSKGMRFS